MKYKKQVISGLIIGFLGIVTGLAYLIFPDFFIKYNIDFGLNTQGLFILGLSLILISVVGCILTIFSDFYKKMVKKHKRTFYVIYIINWIITIFVVLSFLLTTQRIVQSMLG